MLRWKVFVKIEKNWKWINGRGEVAHTKGSVIKSKKLIGKQF